MYLKFEPNTKGVDYCVGDIHGCFDRLNDFLKVVGFNESTDRLFSVGDLCDRGPNSDQVLNWLEQPWFHLVRGNHEQMVIDANDPYNFSAESVLFMNGGAWYFQQNHVKQKEIAFAFESLPFMIEVDTPNGTSFGIVHADVPWNDWNKAKERLYQEDAQVKNYLTWSRDRVNGAVCGKVKGVDYVIVGHTPLPDYQQEDNVLRLDTGAVFKGKYADYANGFTLLNLHTMTVLHECSKGGRNEIRS